MNANQLRQYIVRPALVQINLWSEAAEDLLLGTIATESDMGRYVAQVGGGPALGITQVEPATHIDCWQNWLDYRPSLSAAVLTLVPPVYRISDEAATPVDHLALAACPLYAVAIARVKYYRAPAPLPQPGDWAGMEAYHKKWYNTAAGATRPGQFLAAAKQAGLTTGGERYV
jgi:hypothetical protein